MLFGWHSALGKMLPRLRGEERMYYVGEQNARSCNNDCIVRVHGTYVVRQDGVHCT